MIRLGDVIYTKEGSRTRSPKKKELIDKAMQDLFFAKYVKRHNETKENQEKRIKKAKQKLDELKNIEVQHKHLKRSTKKYKNDKLKSLILELIANEQDNSITVEDYAIKLKAKNGQVYTVFSELVREGVLYNKRPHYAHDTTRNPIFYGAESGWAANYYTIRNKPNKG